MKILLSTGISVNLNNVQSQTFWILRAKKICFNFEQLENKLRRIIYIYNILQILGKI